VRLRYFALLASLLACAPLLTACNDNGFLAELVLSPDTAVIGLPGSAQGSAIDIVRATAGARLVRFPERLDDAEQWDVTLRRTDAGLVLRPFDPVGSQLAGAGVAVAARDFDAIQDAPRGNASYSDEDLPLAANGVYFIRSRQFSSSGIVCVKYAKLKVLALDAAAGTVQFAMVINEGCDDERLADD
jgi:hypothetical protein